MWTRTNRQHQFASHASKPSSLNKIATTQDGDQAQSTRHNSYPHFFPVFNKLSVRSSLATLPKNTAICPPCGHFLFINLYSTLSILIYCLPLYMENRKAVLFVYCCIPISRRTLSKHLLKEKQILVHMPDSFMST